MVEHLVCIDVSIIKNEMGALKKKWVALSGSSWIFKEQNKSMKKESKGYREFVNFLNKYSETFIELTLFYTLDHFRERYCLESTQQQAKVSGGTKGNLNEIDHKTKKQTKTSKSPSLI